MSDCAEPLLAEVVDVPRGSRIDRLLVRLGDRLNPILVKEARQALKSRQFVITFTLLLVCGWVWSILGLGWEPQAAYAPVGSSMLMGYYLILAFPLVVIVPFGAFRSLAVEQDDRTYELMSITALQPRQIVSGKLGSSVAQMLIYLSALSPCLAFTYLLRGIDVVTIVFVILWVVLLSLGLSVISLTIGTLTNERHWQVLLTIGLILGLFLVFWSTSFAAYGIITSGIPVQHVEFWQSIAAALTGYISYFLLCFYAAVARVTFASDNRSTRLRIIMVAQHLLFLGWIAFALLATHGVPVDAFLMILVGLLWHWMVMGAFMTGESPYLSLRARRNLPQSFLGRMLFTWFNPGPATGYVFAVAGATSGVALVAVGVACTGMFGSAGPNSFGLVNLRGAAGNYVDIVAAFGALGVSYLTIYLGIGLLLLRGLRRLGQSGMLLSALIYVLLVMCGCGLPVLLDMMRAPSQVSYSLLQTPNFLWTLSLFLSSSSIPADGPFLLIVLPLAAVGVFFLNLPGIVRELEYVRLAKPTRVAEEDAEREAQLHPPQVVQISPWDTEVRS